MKKVLTAILASLFMGFIGIILGIFANEFFGAADIDKDVFDNPCVDFGYLISST